MGTCTSSSSEDKEHSGDEFSLTDLPDDLLRDTLSEDKEHSGDGFPLADLPDDLLRETLSEDKEHSGDGFPLTDLPDDLLRETLLKLPAQELVKSCMLVSKKWQNFIDSPVFWKDKCKLDHSYTDAMLVTDSGDFKKLYFQNPYSRNLVKNSCAEEGFSNGGCDCEPFDGYPVKKVENIGVFTRTTFNVQCFKTEEIDLVSIGCNPEVLDNLRPDICFSEWYEARKDCGLNYQCKVDLLDKDKLILDSLRFEDTKPGRGARYQNRHVFKGYLSGVRYIKILHGGEDKQSWQFHYGVKITLTDVRFDFSHTSGTFLGEYKLPPQKDDDEDYDPGNYIEWEDEIYDGEGRPRIEGNFDPDYVLEEEIYDVDCIEDNHKISDGIEIQQDQTSNCGVSCPGASEKIPIDL